MQQIVYNEDMKHYKIAIIDDNSNDLNHLQEIINQYDNYQGEKIAFNVNAFSHGLNFLDTFDDSYDAIFLDIDMPVIDGLEVARAIREKGSKVLIIFVTDYGSLAVDGYGVDALGFIVKPAKTNIVFENLDKMIKNITSRDEENKIIIKVKNGYQAITPSEVKYVEVNIHDVFFYTSNGEYKTRGVLKNIEKDFNPKKFVKCSSCFLINLDFVDSIEKNDVRIDGKRIKIARTRKKEFIEAFLNNYS